MTKPGHHYHLGGSLTSLALLSSSNTSNRVTYDISDLTVIIRVTTPPVYAGSEYLTVDSSQKYYTALIWPSFGISNPEIILQFAWLIRSCDLGLSWHSSQPSQWGRAVCDGQGNTGRCMGQVWSMIKLWLIVTGMENRSEREREWWTLKLSAADTLIDSLRHYMWQISRSSYHISMCQNGKTQGILRIFIPLLPAWNWDQSTEKKRKREGERVRGRHVCAWIAFEDGSVKWEDGRLWDLRCWLNTSRNCHSNPRRNPLLDENPFILDRACVHFQSIDPFHFTKKSWYS